MKNLIKVLAILFLTFEISAGVLVTQTVPANPKFTILIGSPMAEVTMGSDIDIWMKVTNISNDPIIVPFGRHGNVDDGYQFDVRDEHDAKVAKVGTRYVQSSDGKQLRLPSRPSGSSVPGGVELGPGKVMDGSAWISDIYQFDRSGRYTIQVSRAATRGKPDDGMIYSNTIIITVLPADATPPENK